MTGLWRLARNPVTRRLYDRLEDLGIAFTRMYEYARPVPEAPGADPPEGVDVDVIDGPAEGREPGDRVVIATDGEARVGLVVASVRPVHVGPLQTEVDFDGGAYIWDLYVEPPHRQRGIATALVAGALRAADDLGADSAHALVALDNYPSRRTFETNGFERRSTATYVGAFGRGLREAPFT